MTGKLIGGVHNYTRLGNARADCSQEGTWWDRVKHTFGISTVHETVVTDHKTKARCVSRPPAILLPLYVWRSMHSILCTGL